MAGARGCTYQWLGEFEAATVVQTNDLNEVWEMTVRPGGVIAARHAAGLLKVSVAKMAEWVNQKMPWPKERGSLYQVGFRHGTVLMLPFNAVQAAARERFKSADRWDKMSPNGKG